ncbi:MAG: hypothetical protein QOJ37_2497 [Pseudonocardiales bacterium]|nr:hypothetical protein [Pseudonocardiales bacterium]
MRGSDQYCSVVFTSGGANGRTKPQPWYSRRWLREVGFVALIYLAYEASRGLQNGALATATRNGWGILNWERAWDLDPEDLLTNGLTHAPPLAVAAAYFYSTMHYLITPIVLVWLYRRHANRYRAARTALAISTIIGLVGFYLLPTAPPRLLTGADVPDTLSDVQAWGWWDDEGSVPRGLGGLSNQFAAMPSMHVGWALWCGFLVYRYASRGWVRGLGAAYPLVTTLVVLSTGNHYLLDAVAGAAVMVMGAGITVFLSWAARRMWCAHTVRAAARLLPPDERPKPSPEPAWTVPLAFFGVMSPTALTVSRFRNMSAIVPPLDDEPVPERTSAAGPH